MNPFINVPSVPSSQEILDVSFGRASKIRSRSKRRTMDRFLTTRATEASKLDEASTQMIDKLTNVVEGFPSLDNIDPFYNEITNAIIGLDKLKEALGALDGYRKVIKSVSRDHIRRIRSAKTIFEVKRLRRAAYGRLSSIIRKAGVRLELLANARDKLRKVVSINVDEPTVVVAGAPNVGKSSLVRDISSAKPEVADYPFTTRRLIIGHLMWGKKRIQVLDTPGLLDRPISERNPLELQAIVALRHHAKLILFLFDPSEICGYTLATQLNVYNEIRDLFGQVPFIIVINKLDILTQEQLAKIEGIIPSGSCVLRISAAKHEGIDLLMDTIFETLSMRSPEKTSGEAQS